MANCYSKLGDDEQAIYYFKKSIENDPKNIIAYYNLAIIIERLNGIENAKTFY